MIRLLVIFTIVAFGVLFSLHNDKDHYEQRRKRYILLVVIILILQSGLRNWAVGSDTYQYYLIFDTIKHQSWNSILAAITNWEGKEPFYGLFQKFFQLFTKSYQLYLCLVAVLFMSALGNFIHKNTTRISHAVLAFVIYMGYYYGFFSITGIRQTLATAFLLWSFEYIKQRKLILFTSFVLIASLFHITALVFLPLYLIAEMKRTKLIFGIALIGFPLVMLFKNELSIFFVFTFGMEERFGTLAEQYYRGGSFILTSLHILLAVGALFIMKKALSLAPEIYRMYNTFALALFFLPLQWVNPSAGRISQYFALIMMVWIPYLIDAICIERAKRRIFLYSFAIMAFVIITSFSILSWDEYKFFWQDMKLPVGY